MSEYYLSFKTFRFFEESDLFVKTLFQFVFLDHDLLFKVLC